jgi:hypothetical protein
MVLTIGPTVGRASRRRAFLLHVVGLLLGSLTVACLTYLVGAAFAGTIEGIGGFGQGVVAIILLLWALRVATGRGLPFPSSRWQVPEVWLQQLPQNVTSFLYGFLLGFGFLTSVVVPVYWCFLLGSVLSTSIAASFFAWGLYAGTRALMTGIGVYRYFEATRTHIVPKSAPECWSAGRVLAVMTLAALGIWLLL